MMWCSFLFPKTASILVVIALLCWRDDPHLLTQVRSPNNINPADGNETYFSFSKGPGSSAASAISETDTTVAHIYIEKASQLRKETQFDSAAHYFERAGVIFEQNYRIDKQFATFERYLFCLRKAANAWFKKQDLDKALGYLRQALEDGSRETGDSTLVMAALFHDLGDVYNAKNEFDLALPLEEKALNIRLTQLAEEHVSVARSYRSLAESYSGKGEYHEAVELLQKALAIKKAVLGNDDPALGHDHNSLGNAWLELARYDQALESYEQALAAFMRAESPDQDLIASAYINLGNAHLKKNDLDSSLEYYQKALDTKTKIFGENHPHVAAIYNNVGILYRRKGESRKALEKVLKALDIRIAVFGASHPSVASTYRNIGSIYWDFADFDSALRYYAKAHSLAAKTLGPDHPIIARIYHSIGTSYSQKGDYDRAREFYQKALALSLRTYGEIHPETGQIYGSLGNYYHDQGDHDKALEYYLQTLKIFKQVRGEKDYYVSGTYSNIGTVYQDIGDLGKAIDFQNQALAIDRDLYGEIHPYVARNYTNLGSIHSKRGELELAREYLFKSEKIKLQTQGEEHPDLAITYDVLAETYVQEKRFSEALDFNRKALNIYLKAYGPHHEEVGKVHRKIGLVYLEQGMLDSALTSYQRALAAVVPDFRFTSIEENPKSFDSVQDRLGLLATLRAKADALEKRALQRSNPLSDLYNALEIYLLAQELVRDIRGGYQTDQSKLLFTESSSSLYDQALQVSVDLATISDKKSMTNQAFSFLEAKKGAVLSEILAELKGRQFSGIPATLLEKERDLRVDLTFYETEIRKEKQKRDQQDSLKIADFEKRFFSLSREYEQLVKTLEVDYPKYYQLKYQVETASVTAVQNALDNQTCLIDYAVGDTILFIFVLSNDDFEIVTVPIDSTFKETVLEFSSSIKKMSRGSYLAASALLYAKLIRPIESSISSKQKLVIIPDGEPYYVPFEALVPQEASPARRPERVNFSDLHYLIRRFEISYHYSATLFVKASQQPEPKMTTSGNFIGFAPVFSESDGNGKIRAGDRAVFDTTYFEAIRAITVDGVQLQEIKFTEDEVEAIVGLFADVQKQSDGYFHKEASEANFKTKVGNHKYIHLATHSLVNEAQPKLSSIVFSQPTDSAFTEDGVLYASETYNLNLSADLVVLSSCESGIGKLVRGEGLMALTRGFLYSGAPNIIFSLWKVYDFNTKELMVEFYRDVIAGKSYAAALRQTKLAMLEDEATAFPAFWSAFVLVGR